jgi:hypothetical protein
MSDDSLLYFLDRSTYPRSKELDEIESPLLLSEWHLPIAWLALFEASDVRIDPSSRHDKDRNYYATKRDAALSRFEKRAPWIRSAVPTLEMVWVDAFRDFLSDAKFHWVHVIPAPFAEDGGAPDADMLVFLLKAFEEPPTPVHEAVAYSSAWGTYLQYFGSRYRDPTSDPRNSCLGSSGTDVLAPWERISN